MTVAGFGNLSLGQCVPLALTATGKFSANVAVRLPQVAARVAGLVSAGARFSLSPPSVAARVDALVAAAGKLTLPVAIVDVSGMAAALASLQAELAALQADLALAASFNSVLGTPGVWAYGYTGTPALYGGEFNAEIGTGLPDSLDPNLPIYAVVFIASDAGAIAAMQTVLAS